MRRKIDLSKIGANVFYKFIYPMFARDFLFGTDYDEFAHIVSGHFILNEKQWSAVLAEWEVKEQILC